MEQRMPNWKKILTIVLLMIIFAIISTLTAIALEKMMGDADKDIETLFYMLRMFLNGISFFFIQFAFRKITGEEIFPNETFKK